MTAGASNDCIAVPLEKLLVRARKRRAETTKLSETRNMPHLADFEEWSLQQIQDVGSTTENFDCFMGVEDPAMMANAGGFPQQLPTPVSSSTHDAEFWDDMTGLLQFQSSDNNGAIGVGEISDWGGSMLSFTKVHAPKLYMCTRTFYNSVTIRKKPLPSCIKSTRVLRFTSFFILLPSSIYWFMSSLNKHSS